MKNNSEPKKIEILVELKKDEVARRKNLSQPDKRKKKNIIQCLNPNELPYVRR